MLPYNKSAFVNRLSRAFPNGKHDTEICHLSSFLYGNEKFPIEYSEEVLNHVFSMVGVIEDITERFQIFLKVKYLFHHRLARYLKIPSDQIFTKLYKHDMVTCFHAIANLDTYYPHSSEVDVMFCYNICGVFDNMNFVKPPLFTAIFAPYNYDAGIKVYKAMTCKHYFASREDRAKAVIRGEIKTE